VKQLVRLVERGYALLDAESGPGSGAGADGVRHGGAGVDSEFEESV
jgi:5-dehydro-4-deoxyglucarate dehydratase